MSVATASVAQGPLTVAPPSFDGHGWLVVINLAVMTAACVLAAMMAIDLVRHIWGRRHRDRVTHPVTIWRSTAVCFAIGIALRAGAEAAVLWNWNPLDPASTASFLIAKRLVDPIAMAFGLAGLALTYLSARGVVEQLRKRPFPINMWANLPMLKRPAAIVAIWMVASIGVVVTR